MILVGPSYSVKNNAVMHIPKNSPSVFSHLHIIAKNKDQELYNYLRDKLKSFITIWDTIPTVEQVAQSGKTTGLQLVVIDDYANDMNLQKNVFSHFFTRGRHFNISTIFLTQSYHLGTYKVIRQNAEYCGILKANSKKDLLMVLTDFSVPFSKEQFYQAYLMATKEKGQLIFIDSVKSEVKWNFDKVIDPETLHTVKLN